MSFLGDQPLQNLTHCNDWVHDVSNQVLLVTDNNKSYMTVLRVPGNFLLHSFTNSSITSTSKIKMVCSTPDLEGVWKKFSISWYLASSSIAFWYKYNHLVDTQSVVILMNGCFRSLRAQIFKRYRTRFNWNTPAAQCFVARLTLG